MIPPWPKTPAWDSFPLLSIAREFAVDYGDVLLFSDLHRLQHAGGPMGTGRTVLIWRAMKRLYDQLGDLRYFYLEQHLLRHALRRGWRRSYGDRADGRYTEVFR